jgi:hypothetical protein
LQITPWICSQIYWKYCIFRNSWQIQHKSNCFLSTMALRSIRSGTLNTHPSHPSHSQWQVYSIF